MHTQYMPHEYSIYIPPLPMYVCTYLHLDMTVGMYYVWICLHFNNVLSFHSRARELSSHKCLLPVGFTHPALTPSYIHKLHYMIYTSRISSYKLHRAWYSALSTASYYAPEHEVKLSIGRQDVCMVRDHWSHPAPFILAKNDTGSIAAALCTTMDFSPDYMTPLQCRNQPVNSQGL